MNSYRLGAIRNGTRAIRCRGRIQHLLNGLHLRNGFLGGIVALRFHVQVGVGAIPLPVDGHQLPPGLNQRGRERRGDGFLSSLGHRHRGSLVIRLVVGLSVRRW